MTFKKTAAQGEITITKVDTLPEGLKDFATEGGHFIVGHSETGHHHVLEPQGVKMFEAETAPAGMRVLYAILDEDKELKHLRSHDTHETVKLDKGLYEFRLGREFDPFSELARRVAD